MKQNENKQEQNQENGGITPLAQPSARQIVGVVLPLCMFAVFLALAVVAVANDMYAFVKPQTEFVLTLDAPQPPAQTAKLLQKQGILKNPNLFLLYARSKGKEDALAAWQGEATLRGDMSYRTLLKILTNPS